MELLRHLKVIVPTGIHLVESCGTKENQTGSHVLANEAANLHEVFSGSKDGSIMFLLIGTDQRS